MSEFSPTSSDDALRTIDAQLYDELRAIAAKALRGESHHASASTTSLVHEIWLRLARADRNPALNQQHLLALASLVARRAIVDAARARNAVKRTMNQHATALPEHFAGGEDPAEIIVVDELLSLLIERHPRQAKALEMRMFGGIELLAIAEALDISVTQAKRDVAYARTWLAQQLASHEPDPPRGGLTDPAA